MRPENCILEGDQCLMHMNYKVFSPPEILRPFVKYFWALDCDTGGTVSTLRAFPDGCPGVIMIQSESAVCDSRKNKLPDIYLHGQAIKASELTYSGKLTAIGVSFQPHALRSVFGINANELTSTGIDLTSVQTKKDRHFSEQLIYGETIEGKIKILSDYLIHQHQNNKTPADELVEYATAQILGSKGCIPLKELQQKLQLSERSLERKFNQVIGISPKLFSRISRFQESLYQLRAGKYDKLSDVAYENEYFDQSYFIRVFKEFTGFSPLQFKKNMQKNVQEGS